MDDGLPGDKKKEPRDKGTFGCAWVDGVLGFHGQSGQRLLRFSSAHTNAHRLYNPEALRSWKLHTITSSLFLYCAVDLLIVPAPEGPGG